MAAILPRGDVNLVKSKRMALPGTFELIDTNLD